MDEKEVLRRVYQSQYEYLSNALGRMEEVLLQAKATYLKLEEDVEAVRNLMEELLSLAAADEVELDRGQG